MQYILNQAEYDEYIMLKENAEHGAIYIDAEVMAACVKKWRIEKIMLPSMPSQYQYHISVNANDMPEHIKTLIDMKIYNGICI